MYGVLERQFRRHFEEAERNPGATGENLLRILESRLDNVVYRLGLADSRKQARQIVRHGHVKLNSHKADIPAALVKVGDVVTVREASAKNEYFKAVREALARKAVPSWLSLDADALSARVVGAPSREQIEANINEALIVEHYSR